MCNAKVDWLCTWLTPWGGNVTKSSPPKLGIIYWRWWETWLIEYLEQKCVCGHTSEVIRYLVKNLCVCVLFQCIHRNYKASFSKSYLLSKGTLNCMYQELMTAISSKKKMSIVTNLAQVVIYPQLCTLLFCFFSFPSKLKVQCLGSKDSLKCINNMSFKNVFKCKCIHTYPRVTYFHTAFPLAT